MVSVELREPWPRLHAISGCLSFHALLIYERTADLDVPGPHAFEGRREQCGLAPGTLPGEMVRDQRSIALQASESFHLTKLRQLVVATASCLAHHVDGFGRQFRVADAELFEAVAQHVEVAFDLDHGLLHEARAA